MWMITVMTGDCDSTLRVSDDEFLRLLSNPDRASLEILHIALGRSRAWRSGERTLPQYVLWSFIQGGVGGWVEGEGKVAIREGALHCLAPGVTHSLSKLEDGRLLRNYLARFTLRVDGIVVTPAGWRRMQLSDERVGMDLMAQVVRVWQGRGTHAETAIRGLLVAIFALIFEQASQPSRQPGQSDQVFSPTQIQGLDAFLEDRMRGEITAMDLAAHVCLSVDYFSRKFRRTFGKAPRAWITDTRLRRAALLLLESNLSIKEIAAETGFSDQRYLARQFRAKYGMTPSEYRHRH